MESSTWGLLKFLFPQIPSLAHTAAWHTLGRTSTSSKWDLKTELTVQVLRHMMTNGGSKPTKGIGEVQATTLKDPGVKGKTWVAKATFKAPSPEDETIREAVFKAIEDLKPSDSGKLTYSDPGLSDINVEWTGYRPSAGKDEPLPNVSEEAKYRSLMTEPTRTSETTILYFHGGAYYLCGLSTHRLLCSRLAKEINGRVCNVEYRLAPQTSFPGQLLDALMVYLSLLYPPPGSLHEPVSAKNIVLSGDSAGGNLTFALLQLLIHLNQASPNPTVKFYGKEVPVPLPAGAAANSGWFDISRAMPSLTTNAKYDYLPPPTHDDAVSSIPHDDIWPTNPPRGDVFCDLSLLDHPLASPLVAASWQSAPPLWLCNGQEMLSDEIKVVASQAASQDVVVHYEEYEAMPHCFAQLLPFLPGAERCLKSWGDFCKRCVEDPASLKTNGTFIPVRSGKEEPREVRNVSSISLDESRRLVNEVKERRIRGIEKVQATPKPAL